MHALPTFTLLTLGALFGTSIANERYKVTWYEDIGCDDFLGTTSDTVDSGCQNIGTSVPALSILADISNGRCGWTITAFAGSDCNGDQHDSTTLIGGQCMRVAPNEEGWKSWSAHANPC
ncbi:hypothetical protein F4821DRAFT_251634 [Hypoxylon rubiginosum]|uniref:Uncharacterized protein n=1 Tax=Hypoxylon rubiginosum TaxID=110542 RepID=A0ACC0CJ08_9PEZI|nr:hypothetical protein F4821DRAFT_251634 [Hypoxylon rubiginosum]